MKNLSTVLETLNKDNVTVSKNIIDSILGMSGLLPLLASDIWKEKHEVSRRGKVMSEMLMRCYNKKGETDKLTMVEYRDILLKEVELIHFLIEYRKKLSDEANKDFDWSSMENKDDESVNTNDSKPLSVFSPPKIVGKIDLNNI